MYPGALAQAQIRNVWMGGGAQQASGATAPPGNDASAEGTAGTDTVYDIDTVAKQSGAGGGLPSTDTRGSAGAGVTEKGTVFDTDPGAQPAGGGSTLEKGGDAPSKNPPPAGVDEDAGDAGRRVIGWTIDNTQSHRTRVIGDEGDVIRVLELPAGTGLRRVGWQASLRGPCRLRISHDSSSWSQAAGTCKAITRSKDATLSAAFATSIGMEPNLDRLLIEGAIIDGRGDFGATEKGSTADRDLSIIDPPRDRAECDPGHVITGIGAHFERRGNGSTKAVGMRLICGKVQKLYE